MTLLEGYSFPLAIGLKYKVDGALLLLQLGHLQINIMERYLVNIIRAARVRRDYLTLVGLSNPHPLYEHHQTSLFLQSSSS